MRLKVNERNKHSEIIKMHVPTILYGYSVQAFRLPFTTQHSPMVGRSQQLRMTTTARVPYGGHRRNALLLRVQHPKATNLHLLMAMAE